jgi:hypothetical protein
MPSAQALIPIVAIFGVMTLLGHFTGIAIRRAMRAI